MLRKGMAATTVRDVAQEMGTSSGLIHHYYASMDELLAEAFERAASQDLEVDPQTRWPAGTDPVEQPADLLRHLRPGRAGLGFPALAGRLGRGRPTSGGAEHLAAAQRRLAGAARGDDREPDRARADVTCPDPTASAWRILSLLDGLALQAVAHRVDIDRDAVINWSASYAESELGLAAGSLR